MMAGTLTTCPICSGSYASIASGAGAWQGDSGALIPALRQCENGGIADGLVNEDTDCETVYGAWPTSMVCICASGTGCQTNADGGAYECL